MEPWVIGVFLAPLVMLAITTFLAKPMERLIKRGPKWLHFLAKEYGDDRSVNRKATRES